MAGDGSVFAQRINLFVRFSLDVDDALVDAKNRRDILLDVLLVRRNLRALRDEGAIQVTDGVTLFLHESDRFHDEDIARLSLPLGIVIRKELTDIRQAQRARDGVDDAVHEHVSIAVRDASAIVRDLDPTDDELEFRELSRGL